MQNNNQKNLTVALRIAVRMSRVFNPPNGSTDSNVRPKVSWNI